MRIFFLLLFSVILFSINAQENGTRTSFLTPSDSLNKGRLIGVSSGLTAGYTGAMVGLSTIWYDQTEKSKFHFFNDAKEWQQVDKAGHLHTSYFESVWVTQMLRWSGVPNKKASIYGSLVGFTFQSSIEIFDGFSDKWGASWSDLGFNALGSGLALTQNLVWEEQRIRTKYSFHQVNHPDEQLLERAKDLYGEGTIERIIKDYNGLVIWVSVTPTAFMKSPERAEWLALSLGYAGGGMYGGFANEWEDENGQLIVRNDIEQYRRFFVSFDVDFERIKTNKPGLKTLFTMLNVIKAPFPAMEFNTKGEVLFHPMFYLNWNKPILLKGKK